MSYRHHCRPVLVFVFILTGLAAVSTWAAAGAAQLDSDRNSNIEALIDLHRRFLPPAQLAALRRRLRGPRGARRVQGAALHDDDDNIIINNNNNNNDDGHEMEDGPADDDDNLEDDDGLDGGGTNPGNGQGDDDAFDHVGDGYGNGGATNGNGNENSGNGNGGGTTANPTSGATGNGGNGHGNGGGMMTNGTSGSGNQGQSDGTMNGNGDGNHSGTEWEDDDAEWEDEDTEWEDDGPMMMNGSDFFCWDDWSGDNDMMDDLDKWWIQYLNDTVQCEFDDGSAWSAGPMFNFSDFLGTGDWEWPDRLNESDYDDDMGWPNMHNVSGQNGWGWSHKNDSSMGQDDWHWSDMNGTLQELMMNWTTMIGNRSNYTFRCRIGNETIWQDGQMVFNTSSSNVRGGGWKQGMNFNSNNGFQNSMMNHSGWGGGFMKNHSGRGGGYANKSCGGLSAEERQHIMFLFRNAGSIQRSVNPIANGIEATTTSSNPDIALVIQQHVAEMSPKRLVRGWDPVFFELYEQHENIQLDVTNISDGVYVVHTGNNPCAADTATAHSNTVTAFLDNGMPEMMTGHDAPSSCEDAASINNGGSSELQDSSAIPFGTPILHTAWGLIVAHFASYWFH